MNACVGDLATKFVSATGTIEIMVKTFYWLFLFFIWSKKALEHMSLCNCMFGSYALISVSLGLDTTLWDIKLPSVNLSIAKNNLNSFRWNFMILDYELDPGDTKTLSRFFIVWSKAGGLTPTLSCIFCICIHPNETKSGISMKTSKLSLPNISDLLVYYLFHCNMTNSVKIAIITFIIHCTWSY